MSSIHETPAPTTDEAQVTAFIVRARNVTKSYDGREVLAGVSLEVRRGERLALTGPSGSGKTTLLNCMGGIDRYDQGSIEFAGRRLDSLDADELTGLRRRHIGTIFQFFHLLPTLTVAENVEFPLQLLRVPPSERRARVGAMIERVGLRNRAGALPGKLSGGEMQRVAIARALVHQPDLVLADEPTGNLDSANGRRILDLLQEMTDEIGVSLVLVTHSDEAAAICHRNVHLRDGRIV